jgi:hypothetical protein
MRVRKDGRLLTPYARGRDQSLSPAPLRRPDAGPLAVVLATLNSEIASLGARAAEIVAADPNLKARFDAARPKAICS